MTPKTKKAAAVFLLIAALLLPSCTGGDTVTTSTGPETDKITETEQITETETEKETETEAETEPEPAYDNAHAYIFAQNDKKSSWVSQGADVSFEFGYLRMVPTNHDPMIFCTFADEERFDSQEYPYAAYRYSVKSKFTQGVFFVCSEDHPSFSDDGLTWVNLNNSGKWVNTVTDMRKNAFWEGTVTAFRIDPINGGELDKNAVIYLDRIGFFKTEEDAEAFLADAKEPDYSQSVSFSSGFAKAVVPGGVLSDGYNSADYLLAAETPAEIKDGVTPIVGIKTESGVEPVPVSYVNSVGFISYSAEQPGEYVLYYPDTPVNNDTDFVKVRGIMTDGELSSDTLTLKQAVNILKKTLTSADSDAEKWAKEYGIPYTDDILTPPDASEAVGAYLTHLGISPYTDPDRKLKEYTDNQNIALCSGIVTDTDGHRISGNEFASIVVRLIKAMLGQPTLQSNVQNNAGITVGVWAQFPFKVTDETIKTLSECGVSLLVDLGDIEQQDTLVTALNSASKYGVSVLRYNYSPAKFNPSKPDKIPSSCYEYYDYDSYLGNIVYDEPGTDKFSRIASLKEYYNNALPGKLCYFNLLPMYANAAQLKYGAGAANIAYYDSDPDLYKNYVEEFAQTVDQDYLCVDIYPYRSSGKSKNTYKEYLKNMDIFAAACREYGRDFWLYIQSTDYDGGKWTPDYDDIRWQMYIGLSFGVKTFIHYQYSWGNYYTFIKDGEPTEIYYAAQKANKEILSLSDVCAEYKNLGAFNLNCEKTKFDYAKFDNQYKDFKVLTDVTSSDPLLFGCFEKTDGDGYAFTVVNMNNINTKKQSASLTFTLDGYDSVCIYRAGEKEKLACDNGVYSLELEPAEGVFITVD